MESNYPSSTTDPDSVCPGLDYNGVRICSKRLSFERGDTQTPENVKQATPLAFFITQLTRSIIPKKKHALGIFMLRVLMRAHAFVDVYCTTN